MKRLFWLFLLLLVLGSVYWIFQRELHHRYDLQVVGEMPLPGRATARMEATMVANGATSELAIAVTGAAMGLFMSQPAEQVVHEMQDINALARMLYGEQRGQFKSETNAAAETTLLQAAAWTVMNRVADTTSYEFGEIGSNSVTSVHEAVANIGQYQGYKFGDINQFDQDIFRPLT